MRWLHSIGPYTPLSTLLWSPGCYEHSFPSGFQLGLADRRYQQGPGEWDGGTVGLLTSRFPPHWADTGWLHPST